MKTKEKELKRLNKKLDVLLQKHTMLDTWLDTFEITNKDDRLEFEYNALECEELEMEISDLQELIEDVKQEIELTSILQPILMGPLI